MASFNKTVKTITRYEYELTSPVHMSEFRKAFAVARADVDRELGNDLGDEVIQVESRDDKVVIVWWAEGEEPA